MIRGFLLQLQFLTRIPLPGSTAFNEHDFVRWVIFAPVVGAVIGLILCGIYYPVGVIMDKPEVAALITVVAWIGVTGGLHLDGLADTCDGIFSNASRSDILKIMKDSRIGTSGALSLILAVVLKLGMLLLINSDIILPSIIVAPILGRMNIVWSAGVSRYARRGKGMGAAIVKKTGWREILIATVFSIAITVPLMGLYSVMVVPGAIGAAMGVVLYARKKIGGITGDIIGAVVEITEITVLLLLVMFR